MRKSASSAPWNVSERREGKKKSVGMDDSGPLVSGEQIWTSAVDLGS